LTHKLSGRFTGITPLVATLLLLAWACGMVWAQGREEEEEIVLKSDTDYQEVASLIDGAEIQATIDRMAALGSRITGSPGCDKAAEMVVSEFKRLGLTDVEVEEFPVTVPVVQRDAAGRAASLTVTGGETFEILPMWPNLVRTPKTPPDGIDGRLIYAGTGVLRAFNGLDVANSIVLLDFNCGADWFNAPLLGAKAVLFIEPEETLRGEAEQKFLSIPVDIPRYWVPKGVSDTLRALLESNDRVDINIKCDMRWQKVTGKNVMAHVKGSDPRLSKQQVVLQAYYDSMSVVPTDAPGAENACSIASLYQLIKAVQHKPPKRSITFLATSGHFQALSGAKHFIYNRIRGGRSEKRVRQVFGFVDGARREIEDAADRVWEEEKDTKVQKTEEEITDERVRALGRIQKSLGIAKKKLAKMAKTIRIAGDEDPNEGKIKEFRLSPEDLEERKELLAKFDQARPAMDQAVKSALDVVKEARRTPKTASMQEKQAALDKVEATINETTDALDFSELGI